MVLISIIFYQSFLTIFFFSQTNLRILGALIVILALKIIFSEYKDKIRGFIQKHRKDKKWYWATNIIFYLYLWNYLLKLYGLQTLVPSSRIIAIRETAYFPFHAFNVISYFTLPV